MTLQPYLNRADAASRLVIIDVRGKSIGLSPSDLGHLDWASVV